MKQSYFFSGILFVVLAVVAGLFISCAEKNTQEYTKIKKSGLTGQKLLSAVTDFETNHSDDFESKLDLADYYMTVGNYAAAEQYLTRAESVIKNAPRGKTGTQMKAQLYGLRAQTAFYDGKYSSAASYVEKAVKENKKAALHYEYLTAQILLAQNKKKESLEKFDEVYKKIPEEITPEDERAYMYLLADTDRSSECLTIMEKYFENGTYFAGLGLFASAIYEKNKKYENSVFSAFLDYEYHSCFYPAEDETFLKNLDTLETKMKKQNTYAAAENAVNLVRSRYRQSPVTGNQDSTFFPAVYIHITNKIKAETLTEDDLQKYLALEHYFSAFPSYYWYAYQAVTELTPGAEKQCVPLFEKILILGRKNRYEDDSREKLGILAGLTRMQARKILIPQEVSRAIAEASLTGKADPLIPVYELLSLPENDYELAAVGLLKEQKSSVNIEPLLRSAYETSSGRLKERIAYILN